MSYPTFTPLGAESSTDKAGEGFASEKKKHNYDMSETKAKGEDYTRPAMDASQTEDDDLRSDIAEKEDYEVSGKDRLTTNENRKNPERDAGRPGLREHQDSFTDTGLPPEGIKVFEDETPVVVDDSRKHGTKLKYRIGGDEGKTGSE